MLDEHGHIATNAHVVQSAQRVKLRVEGDRLVRAAIVGTDLSTALAVVKVDQNDMDRRPLELGSFEAVRAGDPVLALGNPFGLETR